MILSACTYEPDSAWVCQQARNACMELQDLELPISAIIHDRDSKFTSDFDAVFRGEGATVVLTPYRSPQAKAYATDCSSFGRLSTIPSPALAPAAC